MSRPLILVTNDDGAFAPGIKALAEVAAEYGDVVVCAPSQDRSGVAHSISLHEALRVYEVREGVWAVTGTPVDCVYVGAIRLCERRPDLVLSGINHGYNLGSDVYYSGTAGAAREGHIRGSHALGVSMGPEVEVESVMPFVRGTVEQMLSLKAGVSPVLLNLNVPPNVQGDAPVVTRLGNRNYQDKVLERKDLKGKPYYWIGGPPAEVDGEPGTDVWATFRGYASLTPLQLDCTAPELEHWHARLGGPSIESVLEQAPEGGTAQ